MSPSMWAWRVLVPGVGVAACSLVLWRSTRAEPAAGLVIAPSPAATAAKTPARPARDRVVAEGRIAARPGAEITLGTEAGGTVAAVPVVEKAAVRKGDLLVEFRDDDLRSALVEAEARVAEVDAELAFLGREYQRRAKASSQGPQFQADLDGNRRDLETAAARRRGSLAGVARCRSALGRARVTSPIDGVVIARFVEAGETAPPSARLVTVCDLARLRVEAEVDEFDAARIHPGDDVVITAEGYGDASWPGAVEEIPDRVGERTTRPEDPGRPSDTRVLVVKIAPARPLPLRLGQQVEVEIRPRR